MSGINDRFFALIATFSCTPSFVCEQKKQRKLLAHWSLRLTYEFASHTDVHLAIQQLSYIA